MRNLSFGLLDEVTRLYGSPVFVYDAAVLRERLAALRADLRYEPLRVLYSGKANPAVGIVSFFERLGCGFDACSPGDLHLAELAGVSPEQVSFTGFGLTDKELESVAARPGDLVLDSTDDLDRLHALGIRRPVGLRINPGIVAGFHAHVAAGAATAKFGIAGDLVPIVARQAERKGLPVVGLHAHLGSDVMDAAAHTRLLQQMHALTREIGGIGWINIGGGWGTPRDDSTPRFPWSDLAAAASDLLGGQRLELRIEPGGYLTMDAGVLVGTVASVRPGDADRPDTIVTDASTNHLPSVLLYDAAHDVQLITKHRREGRPRRYRVVGNLMQAGDVLATEQALPEARAGDFVALSHAGAYAASRATTFNERPRAAEVLLDGQSITLLRRAETIEELFGRDSSPLGDTICRPLAS